MSKSSKISFDEQRLLTYFKKNKEACAAIFDVGTRAIRLLVAPKNVPGIWKSYSFCNIATLTELGSAVNPFADNKLDTKSRNYKKTIDFLKLFKKIIVSEGVSENDIHAVGTAVFRIISNQNDVINDIQKQTGIRLEIISDEDEARYSLYSVFGTVRMLRDDIRPVEDVSDDDALLLIDQGGGSTEVSYMFLTDDTKYEVHSFEKLGTVALENDFYKMGHNGKYIDPTVNNSHIDVQIKRVRSKSHKIIDSWPGYPSLNNKRIHAYAMGAVATNMFPNTNNYKVHNKLCPVEEMEHKLNTQLVERFQKRLAMPYREQRVKLLYKMMQMAEFTPDRITNVEKFQKQVSMLKHTITMLYGLPVYIEILRKFDLAEMRICGYGLRYGVYCFYYLNK